MKTALKWLALTILSILLFVSLTVFGVALTAKTTVLDSRFVSKEINKFPMTVVGKEWTDSMTDFEPEIKSAINQTIIDMEPKLKQDLGSATNQVYDYLLGKKPSPEIAKTLSDTIFSNDFVYTLIEKSPVAAIASNEVLKQLHEQKIPQEWQFLLDYVPSAFADAEPDIKDQLKKAAQPIIDYLLGKNKAFQITLDLQPVYESLKNSAIQEFLQNPPAELSDVSPELLSEAVDQYVNQNFQQVLNDFPLLVTIDQTNIGNDTPANVKKSISEVEARLIEFQPAVHLFQTYYIWLIVLIVVLIAGIAAISHSIKLAARVLAVVSLLYGIINYGGILVCKWAINSYLVPSLQNEPFVSGTMPPDMVSFIRQVIYDFISPLHVFSLVVLVAGALLLVVSFVYKTRAPEITEDKSTETQV